MGRDGVVLLEGGDPRETMMFASGLSKVRLDEPGEEKEERGGERDCAPSEKIGPKRGR